MHCVVDREWVKGANNGNKLKAKTNMHTIVRICEVGLGINWLVKVCFAARPLHEGMPGMPCSRSSLTQNGLYPHQ